MLSYLLIATENTWTQLPQHVLQNIYDSAYYSILLFNPFSTVNMDANLFILCSLSISKNWFFAIMRIYILCFSINYMYSSFTNWIWYFFLNHIARYILYGSSKDMTVNIWFSFHLKQHILKTAVSPNHDHLRRPAYNLKKIHRRAAMRKPSTKLSRFNRAKFLLRW